MQIKLINTQKVLSPTNITIADYVINPFRGCSFGCLYCYSQENKNIKDTNFSHTLGVKINAPDIIEKELRYITPKRVLLGSTTECFQYAESKYQITGQILRILTDNKIPYTILTKSHLIKGYLPLISQNYDNKIYFTINCSSNKIIRFLEEKSPLLEQRIETIKEIITRKINLRIHIGPFFPYLSSLKEIIALLPQGIKEIDIELYHHKMGRFNDILNIIKENLGKEIRDKLYKIYSHEENYLKFAENLKNEIKNIHKKHNFKFFFIVPDFNKFYNSLINYENSLF